MLRPHADLAPPHRLTSRAAAFPLGSARVLLLASALLLLAGPLQSGCAKAAQPATEKKTDATPRTQAQALDYSDLPDWSLLSDHDYSVPRGFFGPYSFAGRGVSISIDGDTAAVGSFGVVELFGWDAMSNTWAYQRSLTEPAGVSHRFGASVSISGDTLVVGSPSYEVTRKTGRVSIYERSGNTWTLVKHIVSPNPDSQDNLEFGAAVVVRGDVLAVGAPGFQQPLTGSVRGGRVFTYLRSGNWDLEQQLAPQGSEEGDRFGAALALSDTVLAVGAPGDRKTNGSEPRGGRVYAYQNQGTSFSRGANDEAEPPSIPAVDCEFGASIAVTNDLVIVGAPSATNENNQDEGGRVFAYSYTQSSGLTPLGSAGITRSGSDPGERFGEVVVMDASTKTVAVTSSQLFRQTGELGTVHVFDEDPNTMNSWLVSTALNPSEMDGMTRFGRALALDGGRLLVGAARDEPPHNDLSGALYAFTKDQNMAGVWTQGFRKPGGLPTIDGLGQGNAVAISGDLLAYSATPSNIATPVPDGKFPFVRIYKRDENNPRVWIAQTNNASLFEKPLLPDSRYGEALAFHDNYLFVSKPDEFNSEVFAYKYDGVEWSEVPDALSISNRADALGSAMVAGDGWLALGRGDSDDPIIEVHDYDATRGVWSPAPSPAIPNDIDSASSFGRELVAHGQHLATFDEIKGRVYIFTRQSAAQWGVTTIDIDPMGEGDAPNAIAIHGDMLAVSVDLATSAANALRIYKHENYVDGDPYEEVNAGGSPITTASMALTARTLAVGDITPKSPGTTDLGGRVTLFHLRPDGLWRQVPNLLPFQPAFARERGYDFGQNIAMQDMEIIIGSPNDSSEGLAAGSVVLYSAGIGCDAQRSCSSVHICDMTEPTHRCEEVNTCGNSRVEEGEDCDDGNLEDGDGCSATCSVMMEGCTNDGDCGPDEVCDNSSMCVPALMGCVSDEDCTPKEMCNDQAMCVPKPGNNAPGFEVEVSEPGMGAEYKEGEVVTVRGTTAPGADVELFLRRPGAMNFEQGSSKQAGSDGAFTFPLEKLSPGSYAIQVAAKSNDVIVEGEVISFRVLVDPKLQVGGEDVDGENPNEVEPGETIAGFAAEGTNIIVEVNGVEVCNLVVGPSGRWECTLPQDVESGEVVVKDGDGNILGSFTISVVSGRGDTLPPPDAGCSCSSSDAQPPSPALPILLFFAFAFARLFSKRARRFGSAFRSGEQRRAAVLLAAAVMLVMGCSQSAPTAPTQPVTPVQKQAGESASRQQPLDFKGTPYWGEEYMHIQELLPVQGIGFFGSDIAVSGDTMVIASLGEVSIFEWDATENAWGERQQIYYPGSEDDWFGSSVSIDGGTLVVGAPSANTELGGTGKVFIYERNATPPVRWEEVDVLVDQLPAPTENFGKSVALRGDTLVVGAPTGSAIGSAHVFERSQGTWNSTPITKLQAAVSNSANYAGTVAISGQWIAVSASNDNTSAGVSAGRVYLYEKISGAWAEADIIEAETGASSSDKFGEAIALSDTTLIVSAVSSDVGSLNAGMVYAYDFDGTSWGDETLLDAFDINLAVDAEIYGYGVSVAWDEVHHRAFIGAHETRAPKQMGRTSGVIFSWDKSPATKDWGYGRMYVGEERDGIKFGAKVAANDAHLLGVATLRPPSNSDTEGMGGVFSWTIDVNGAVSNGHITQALKQNDDLNYGKSVDIKGDLIAIGAPHTSGNNTPGEVSIFRRVEENGTRWHREARLVSDGASDTNLGQVVRWVGDALLIGNGSGNDKLLLVTPDPNGGWSEPDRVLPFSGADGFPQTTASDGDRALLSKIGGGSPLEFYRYDAMSQRLEELASLTDLSPEQSSDFGTTIALGGDIALATGTVGAGKRVFIHEFDGSSWSYKQTLEDPTRTDNTCFGAALATDGDLIAVTSCLYNGNTPDVRRVYIFARDPMTDLWGQVTSVQREGDNANANAFGETIRLVDRTLLVAAPGLGPAAGENGGKIFVFEPRRADDLTDWDHVTILTVPEAPSLATSRNEQTGRFGEAMDMQKGEVVVGMYLDSIYGTNVGTAFVFKAGIGCDMGECGGDHICDFSESPTRCEQERVCGNSATERDEGCDDGNLTPGDGCDENCLIEEGMQGCVDDEWCATGLCNTNMLPGTCVARDECGNSFTEAGEGCDDGNLESGDGCDENCQQETTQMGCISDSDCAPGETCNAQGMCIPEAGNNTPNNTPGFDVDVSEPGMGTEYKEGEVVTVRGTTAPGADVELFLRRPGAMNFEQGSSKQAGSDGAFTFPLEKLSPGSYAIQVAAKSNDVIVEGEVISFRVLVDPKLQVGGEDVDGENPNEVEPGETIAGFAAEGTNIIVEVNGVEVCNLVVGPSGRWECTLPQDVESGEVVVKDGDGNILGSFTISVVSGRGDTLPPPDAGCSCSSSDAQPPSPALPILLFFAFAFARLFSKRARRFGSGLRMSRSGRIGLVAAAVTVTLLAACSQSSSTAPTQPAAPTHKQAGENASLQQPLDYEGNPYWDDTLLHEEEILPRMGYSSFGQAIALDGDTMAVSTRGDVRLFEWNDSELEWEEYQQIFFEDSDDANFGSALVLAGDLLFVGTNQATIGNTVNTGKVYMYRRRSDDPRRWDRSDTIILPPTPREEAYFGSSLAFDPGSGRLVVGAPGSPMLPSTTKGHVYIFAKDQGGPDNWGLEKTLEEVGIDEQDRFGSAVSIHGDWLAVGVERDDILGAGTSTGSVYLYNHDGFEWLVKGPPLEPTNTGGQTDDIYFGYQVLLTADELFIGAPGLQSQGSNVGRVYHYKSDGMMSWSTQTPLDPPVIMNGDTVEGYGSALAFDQSDDRLFIGAPVSQYMNKRGMVFAMKRAPDPEWVVDDGPYITYGGAPSTGSSLFGDAIAADAGFLIAAAPSYEDLQDDTVGPGRVFSYEVAADGTTSKERWISAVLPQSNLYAGSGVALSRDLLAIAAPGDLGTMANRGSVTIYKRQEDPMRRWRRAQTIYSPNPGTEFGEQLAWVKDILVIGDPQDLNNDFYIVRPIDGAVDLWGPPEAVSNTVPYFALGAAMASDGDRVLVGSLDLSSDELLFFEYDSMTRDLASLPSLTYGQAPMMDNRSFGHTIALDDNRAVVRVGDDEVLVYHFANGSWDSPQTLPMVDTSVERNFDIDGDLIAINALDGFDREVRVYKRDPLDDEWEYTATIQNPDIGDTGFAAHLKVIDKSIIISAPNGDGIIYIYEPEDDTYTSWTSVKKIDSPAPFETLFGVKFDAQKGEVAVGAPVSNAYEDQSGTAHVYRYGIDCAAGQCGGGHVCDTSEMPTRCEAVGTCGNGVQDAWETCDDGNLEDNDMCPSDCGVVELQCITDVECGEDSICESNECRPANTCGNGRMEMEETCDDGNTEDNDMCPADCGVEKTECISDADCPEDEVCNAGMCEARPPNNTPAEWMLELSAPTDRKTFRLGEEFEVTGVVTPGAYLRLLAEGEDPETLDFIEDIEGAETLANDGDFSFTSSGDDLGAEEGEVSSYTLKVIAEDTQNSENTDLEIERTIFILPNEEVKVGDDEVAPGEENEVTPGETISGYAIPNSRVIVEVDGIVICDTRADDKGIWTCLIPEDIRSGDVVVKDEDGNILGEFTISVVSGRDDLLPPPNPGCTCSSLDGSGPSPAAPLLLFLTMALARLFSKRARMARERSRVVALTP